MFWKTKTINGVFHMYKGEQPNCYWEEYEPDIDTLNYYDSLQTLPSGNYAVIEINENEI